ncbi:hypothetical protein [Paenibacillus soyae]|uniref:Uncharacterized protein n=1 Tax=Paenibacillus soyae TaxID=2969249 RepID=A0A9X2SAN7_9BACL|nr:hypothetical protein [Paenibacillus soyae]MCR2804803.1 hypothetical protein [Paenibacillus soyae]
MHPNKRYTFVTREVKVLHNNRLRSYMTIAIQDKKTLFLVTHPVTEFIRSRYAEGSNNNTQKAPAEAIKRFLNWLLIEMCDEYGLQSFEDLRIHHGRDYLEYLGMARNNKRSTVMGADRYLTEFYYFLYRKKILPESMKVRLKTNMAGKEIPVSPFIEEGLALPEEDNAEMSKITDFPDLSLIQLFVDTAMEIAPDIAFGIYLQIFGGLRKGEVVNLNRASIHAKGNFGSKGMKVVINDRPELFNHLSDLSKSQVKNPRTQPIQVIVTLPIIYKQLLARLDKAKCNHKLQPIFLDQNNNPMSGAVYERRFQKVKKAFIKKLIKMRSPYLSTIQKYNWSTHIGRGIYTNLMARVVKSPMELALLRGDKSLDAALEYMSLMRVTNEVQQGLEDMYSSSHKEKLKVAYSKEFCNPDSSQSNQEREQLNNNIIVHI